MQLYFNRPGLAQSQQLERKQRLREIGSKVFNIFFDNPEKYGFEIREGQQEMACEIIDAITDGSHLAVEAGVGIGKSYAYLIPLLFYSQAFNRPVVVATSTIALQEQLLSDVQRLQEMLNTGREVILAKGQAHYVCSKRAGQYITDPAAPLGNEIKAGLEAGAQERKDFGFPIPAKIWEKINVSRFSMHACNSCSDKCLYYHIRDRLQFIDGIILCNQDFLTAHLRKKRRMQRGLISDRVDLVVIDEAHNLEDKVRTATTECLSQGALLSVIRAATKEVPARDQQYIQRSVGQAEAAVRAFFSHLRQQVQLQIAESVQDTKYADRFFFRENDTAMALLRAMSKGLDDLADDVEIQLSRTEIPIFNTSASDELENTVSGLSDLLDDFNNQLVWIERKGSNADLVYCPKNTKQVIRRLFFDSDVLSILTSATLTTAGQGELEEQYSYFIDSTGFPIEDGALLSDPKPSPFPYNEHAMIYYCDDLPHPTKEHEEFIKQGTARLVDILNISGGKALVLFTAKTDMEEVYAALQGQKLPYKILMQQAGSSQESVLQEFEHNTDSVLLGTGAYWEGISIEGKSLSNLVIFRLPFPVPDPIITYKESISSNALMKVMVPEMVTKLKQGVGRLIRNFTDTGIISIIDPRLKDINPKPYRDVVWKALPISNRTNNLQELQEFYNRLP